MTYALVTGSLFRAPEQRTSKANKPYVTATIKAKDGDAFQFWRVTAFADTVQAELLRLTDGDAVSVQGSLKAELYAKDGGEQKLSLSLIAEHVLVLRQPRKPREPDSDRATQRPAGDSRVFDDAISY
jgi:single-stranded DNA-binding protein